MSEFQPVPCRLVVLTEVIKAIVRHRDSARNIKYSWSITTKYAANNLDCVVYLSLGSIVQKGKFSAAAWDFVSTLKNVDFPTLGIPTIPILRLVPTRPIKGLTSGSCFLGGILLLSQLKRGERGYLNNPRLLQGRELIKRA